MEISRFYLYTCTCIVLTDSFLTVTHALLNISLPVQLNLDAVLPCRLPMDGYKWVNVRWRNEKDGWLTDGTTIYKHRGVISINKPAPNEWNLRIKRVTMPFEDTYTCQTGSGTIVSIIKLVIESSPRISEDESSPIRITVTETDMATLKCTATGTPEPEITWYRGLSENYVGITGSVLKIPDISRYATDEYICRATNRIGEAERRIGITVNFAPKVSVMESVIFASGGEVAVMSCVVQSSPLYDVYWTRGEDAYGTPIQASWKYFVLSEEGGDNVPVRFLTLVIRKNILSRVDYGVYSCVAKGENRVAMDTVELRERKQKIPRRKGR